jgi:protein gp37
VALNSSIEWTEGTWNPVTGCSKISPGCKHCYAERMATRLHGMGQPRYRNGFEVTLQPDLVRLPLRWKQPRAIFVNSMSDLFHEEIPEGFIADVFQTMRDAHWHTFQILTKRAERLKDLAARLSWPMNVWMGVSIESPRYSARIDHLRAVPAAVRFLSVEPLLARIPSLNLPGVDWVIVGGESGPGARPMEAAWVRELRDRCVLDGVPFFFKQWGGTRKKRNGRLLDGRTWDEMPKPILRRQARPLVVRQNADDGTQEECLSKSRRKNAA